MHVLRHVSRPEREKWSYITLFKTSQIGRSFKNRENTEIPENSVKVAFIHLHNIKTRPFQIYLKFCTRIPGDPKLMTLGTGYVFPPHQCCTYGTLSEPSHRVCHMLADRMAPPDGLTHAREWQQTSLPREYARGRGGMSAIFKEHLLLTRSRVVGIWSTVVRTMSGSPKSRQWIPERSKAGWPSTTRERRCIATRAEGERRQ